MAALSTALIVSGIVGAAGSLASAKMNSNAAKRAQKAQSQATADAQQLERDAEAENRRQFDLTQEQNEFRWNSERAAGSRSGAAMVSAALTASPVD